MFDDDPRRGDSRERDNDARDLDDREREPGDPRDASMRDLDLPRGHDRQRAHDRDREYTLRESESRTLSTIGAFRVVSSRDLTDHQGRQMDPRSGDLRHLREQGLVRTIPIDGSKDVAVVLTDRVKHLLESHRHNRDRGDRQQFYADFKKPREMEHDAQIYGAYVREAERLEERGARVDRVVLDYELKREYQQWLHERDRGGAGADGRPDRNEDEISDWAYDRLATALPAAVADALTAIGIPAAAIEQERAQMSPLRFGRIHSRSLLGSLTEFTRLAWFDFMTRRDVPLDVIAHELADVPLILPFKGEQGATVTRRLFGVE